MKLYEIPENSKIRLDIAGEYIETKTQTCIFRHIDGMYSYIETEEGQVVHLSAAAPLKLCADGIYELDESA